VLIYEQPEPADTLSQGDIVDGCSILFWEYPAADTPAQPESASTSVRVVVLTQACDLAQAKATRVLVAVVHQVQRLVERGVLQSKVIRDQIRTHRVYGWYFLPAGDAVEESIVDMRDLHTIPRAMLDKLIKDGKRVTRIRTPFREHLAQHFSTTYARIGLPEPYPSQAGP
jgi:hypothetical protein